MAASVVIVPAVPTRCGWSPSTRSPSFSNAFRISPRTPFVHAAKDSRSSCGGGSFRRKRSVRATVPIGTLCIFLGSWPSTQTSSVDHPPTSATIREEVVSCSDPSTPFSIRSASSSPLTTRRGRPVCFHTRSTKAFPFLASRNTPVPTAKIFSARSCFSKAAKAVRVSRVRCMAFSSRFPAVEKFPPRRVMLLSIRKGRNHPVWALSAKSSRTVFEPTSKEAYRGSGMEGIPDSAVAALKKSG